MNQGGFQIFTTSTKFVDILKLEKKKKEQQQIVVALEEWDQK